MTFEEELKTIDNPAILLIADYLKDREDVQDNLKKPNKSLKKMYEYIVSEAKKKASNECAMLSDEEVFGLAVHYYDEDNLTIDKVVDNKSSNVHTQVKVKVESKKCKIPNKKKEEIEEEQLSLF